MPDAAPAVGTGWWVVVQFPLLLLAYLIPGWTGMAITGSLASMLMYAGQALLVAGAGRRSRSCSMRWRAVMGKTP